MTIMFDRFTNPYLVGDDTKAGENEATRRPGESRYPSGALSRVSLVMMPPRSPISMEP